MTIWLALGLLVLASVILTKSANTLVHAAISVARSLHVNEFNLGFFVLGMMTTLPEIFVGLNAVIDSQPELSLGNLMGGSIILLSLIIGLNAILGKEVHFVETFTQKEMLFTSLIILAPVLFFIDGNLSRLDGLCLISLYIIFYILLNRGQHFSSSVTRHFVKNEHTIANKLSLTIISIIGLAVSAKIAVESAEYLATYLSLSIVFIGMFFVSIGTNLPELTIMFVILRHKHQQIALGDFLGSAVANTPVLGLIALISPFTLTEPLKIYLSVAMLAVTLFIFNAFFSIDKKITRIEGISLVSLFIFFFIAEMFLK